jgi:hypothetical protein
MVAVLLRHVRRHVVGYIALFVALGGVTYAAIPDGSGVIHGCYDTSAPVNGAYPLYVIDTSKNVSCPEGQRGGTMTPLTWNQQGSPGQPGQPGAPGQQGPQGTPGAGVSTPPNGLRLAPGISAVSPQLQGNGKETTVYKKTPGSSQSSQSVTLHCPKSYPVALYPSVNTWYWPVQGQPNNEFAAGLNEFYEEYVWGGATLNVHSLRVAGTPGGWTTEWVHLAVPGEALKKIWGVDLALNCATVAASKTFNLNVKLK